MKILLTALILYTFISVPAAWPQTDKEVEKQLVKYQLEISTKTSDHIQEAYDKFHESFLDFDPALERIYTLIHEYNKAIQLMPEPMPEEALKLHGLMKKLLARVETYFLYYKRNGRESIDIKIQVLQTMADVSREAQRLAFLYM